MKITLKKPTAEELNKIDLSEKMGMLKKHPDAAYFTKPAGQEHYRLLHYLNDSSIHSVEFGTFRGLSSLALYSKLGIVTTFDVAGHDMAVRVERMHHCAFIKYDGRLSSISKEINLLSSRLIFLDTMHDGKFEKELIDHLVAINWKGILIADDIHLNPQMEEWWNNIAQRKEDWTDIGHWSGTGIIYFE